MIGTVLGMIAGYFGGWVDALIGRAMDMFLAFPLLLFAIVLGRRDPRAGVRADRQRLAHRNTGVHHRLLQLALHRPGHPRSDAVAA